MALDHQEQEQLEAVKAWWKQHGNLVLLVISAALIAIAAWRGWDWYQRSQALRASVMYEALVNGAQAGNAKAMRDAGGELTEKYPGTLYASMGALVSARFYFDRHENKDAEAQLEWVLQHSSSDDFKDIARLRLAAVLLDGKSYDDALKQLEAPHAAAYAAPYAALRGDILAAKHETAAARAAYQLALDKADKQASAFRDSVRMRLEALGG
jgi:predicted negative regulator of RcsB-dependent stress response